MNRRKMFSDPTSSASLYPYLLTVAAMIALLALGIGLLIITTDCAHALPIDRLPADNRLPAIDRLVRLGHPMDTEPSGHTIDLGAPSGHHFDLGAPSGHYFDLPVVPVMQIGPTPEPLAATPEPSTLGLLGLALVAAGAWARRSAE